MGLAPNEKHLEDWIVQNPLALGFDEYDFPPLEDEIFPHYELVGRQVPLPSGYCDLVAEQMDFLSIIELKKGAIGFKAFAQLLRYMRDVREVWNHGALGGLPIPDNRPDFNFWLQPHIRGVLIGHSVEGGNDFLIAAESAGVRVATYNFTGQTYEITWHQSPGYPLATFSGYAMQNVGQLIRTWYMGFISGLFRKHEIDKMGCDMSIESYHSVNQEMDRQRGKS